MVSRQDDPALDTEASPRLEEIPAPAMLVDAGEDRIIDANDAAGALASCSPADLMVLPLGRALAGDEMHSELRVGDRAIPVHVIGPQGWRKDSGPAIIILLDRLSMSLAAMEPSQLTEECDRLRLELEESRTRQERMVSVWAHELKTPLTVVQSYLEILTGDLDDGLSDEQLHFLQITKESVHRLRRLVLDLVDLIGFRSGHLSIETDAVDVATILDNVMGEMQPLATDAELELVHERPAIRVAVTADGDRVSQIMRNLIDNAFKFTPPGGTVTVRTRVERDWVIIDVVDDGLGIHPTDIDRVFEEFVQLKRKGARRKHRGSGLGLAISQRIAEAHGGAIEVESALDEGSVFSVRLPREHETEEF